MRIKPNLGKNCFITIDFEDWDTIPYLRKYNFRKDTCPSFCTGEMWRPFFERLDKEGIHPTLFVVATTTSFAMDTLLFAKEHGFAMGCHAYNHENLQNMSLLEFVESTKKAKRIIEEAVGVTVDCYRAPSFSASKEMILALPDLGFKLDSSFINSSANEYYTQKDFSDWLEDENGFLTHPDVAIKEIEIPTIKFLGKTVPIGGGGFFRLLPFWLYKHLVKKYLKTHQNFVFFIHPYELNYHRFPGMNKFSLKERIRFNFRRKTCLKKFWKAIAFFKREGMTFLDFGSFLSKD